MWAALYYFYLDDHVSYSLLFLPKWPCELLFIIFTYITMWATLYYFLPRWPCELLFIIFFPKWPCELLFIIFYLDDHVSYSLLFFT